MATAEQLDDMSPRRPDNITEDQWNGIHKIWKLFDANGDGCIEASEVIVALQALGANPTPDEVASLMRHADLDDKEGQKVITKKKFYELVCNGEVISLVFTCDHKAQLRKAFQKIDKNGDGFITAKELRQVMGEENNGEVEEMIRLGDTDNDGKLDYNEFVSLMCKQMNH